MIKPTVGRVVLYIPRKDDPCYNMGQPLSASIAHVHNDRLINIGFLARSGEHCNRESVILLQEGDPVPEDPYCRWMDYQLGQAAKTERAEQKLSAEEASKKGFNS